MTKDEVMVLSDKELKLKAAALEGFECRADGVYGPDGLAWYLFADPRAVGPTFSYADILPDYTSDIASAWELVDRLKTTDQRERYVHYLTEVVLQKGYPDKLSDLWYVIHAPARDQTRAFILAMTQREEDDD